MAPQAVEKARNRLGNGVPPGQSRDVAASRLGVMREIVRRIRAPHIERILWRVVAALPVAIGRDEVDPGGIFAERPPRIADIVEEIGAQHVPPQSPSFGESLVEHMHGAAPDVVDRAHVPAQVMESRRGRLDEGDHVMVAAVDAVQKRDAVARPVGKAQAERSRIELNRAPDVAGEEQDMRKAPRRDALNVSTEWRAAHAGARRDLRELRLLVWRGFRRDLDLHEVPIVIVKPEAVRIDPRRRVEPLDAKPLKPLGEAVEIVFEHAERDMPELLARTLADRDPDMRIAARLHGEDAAVLIDLESELAVEISGDLKIGNGEMKPIDRMHAKFARTSRRLDGAADGGHGVSSLPTSRLGRDAGR